MPFNLKYRPQTFDEYLGNESTVKSLKGFINNPDRPRTYLFYGPSGTGKTTIARILANELNCSDRDYMEMNIADTGGIDDARKIIKNIRYLPLKGNTKVYVFDEIQRASTAFQQGLLKTLEDTPKHVIFILCTTNPERLLKTVKNRCQAFQITPLTIRELSSLLNYVIKEENLDIEPEAVRKIAETVEGSPRQALILLEQISELEPEQQTKEIKKIDDLKKQAIDLCRVLIQKNKWKDITNILNNMNINNENAEGIRQVILGYCNSVQLRSDFVNSKAFLVADSFLVHNFYESGKAKLINACCSIFLEE